METTEQKPQGEQRVTDLPAAAVAAVDDAQASGIQGGVRLITPDGVTEGIGNAGPTAGTSESYYGD